jgi:hypothetical protein
MSSSTASAAHEEATAAAIGEGALAAWFDEHLELMSQGALPPHEANQLSALLGDDLTKMKAYRTTSCYTVVRDLLSQADERTLTDEEDSVIGSYYFQLKEGDEKNLLNMYQKKRLAAFKRQTKNFN